MREREEVQALLRRLRGRLRPLAPRAATAAAVAIAGAFVALALALAWERPLCCIDDAAFAVVAKNLATGHGYVASFGPTLDRPFAPWIGTGPTSIVPAGLAIALFGADPRVPGLAHVALWAVALALAVRASARLGARPWLLLGAFAALQLASSARHFAQWYVLLGEVPAALLAILGAAVLARDGAALRHAWASGVALGLAVLAKLIALFYVAGPLVWLLASLRRDAARGAKRALAFVAGFLAPQVAFEGWKIAVLGVPGWIDHLNGMRAFVLKYGTSGDVGTGTRGTWAEIAHRATLLGQDYGVGPLLVVATAVLAGIAARRIGPAASRFVAFLLAGVAVHLLYWFAISNGRPRYAFVAAVVAGFALAFLAATVRAAALRLGAAALALWIVAACLPHLQRPWRQLAEARAAHVSPMAAAEAMAAAIREHTRGAPVAALNWGSVSTLEYLADEPGRFQIPPGEPGTIEWAIGDDRVYRSGFDDRFAACETVARHAPYTLKRCAPAGGGG